MRSILTISVILLSSCSLGSGDSSDSSVGKTTPVNTQNTEEHKIESPSIIDIGNQNVIEISGSHIQSVR